MEKKKVLGLYIWLAGGSFEETEACCYSQTTCGNPPHHQPGLPHWWHCTGGAAGRLRSGGEGEEGKRLPLSCVRHGQLQPAPPDPTQPPPSPSAMHGAPPGKRACLKKGQKVLGGEEGTGGETTEAHQGQRVQKPTAAHGGPHACYGLAAAGNKSATRPPLPLPGCGGEWKERGRKLVGRDKGSLTEQQTEGTGTTTIQIRGKHNTNLKTQRAALHDRRLELPSRE